MVDVPVAVIAPIHSARELSLQMSAEIICRISKKLERLGGLGAAPQCGVNPCPYRCLNFVFCIRSAARCMSRHRLRVAQVPVSLDLAYKFGALDPILRVVRGNLLSISRPPPSGFFVYPVAVFALPNPIDFAAALFVRLRVSSDPIFVSFNPSFRFCAVRLRVGGAAGGLVNPIAGLAPDRPSQFCRSINSEAI